jgi:succinyl-CoA synthetase alpha subunit
MQLSSGGRQQHVNLLASSQSSASTARAEDSQRSVPVKGSMHRGHHAGPQPQTGQRRRESRSGTLTYEIASHADEFGRSTVVGIGGDPVIGTHFIDCLDMFNQDPETKAIVMVGEIGGTDEERAAEFVKANVKKPVLGFIAGQTAPPGKRMGHAGAIISGGSGTAGEKVAAFEAAGIQVVFEPQEVADRLKAVL